MHMWGVYAAILAGLTLILVVISIVVTNIELNKKLDKKDKDAYPVESEIINLTINGVARGNHFNFVNGTLQTRNYGKVYVAGQGTSDSELVKKKGDIILTSLLGDGDHTLNVNKAESKELELYARVYNNTKRDITVDSVSLSPGLNATGREFSANKFVLYFKPTVLKKNRINTLVFGATFDEDIDDTNRHYLLSMRFSPGNDLFKVGEK
ncbi:ORF31, VP24, gene family 1 [White spot syndrome virus]|uniref:Wsv002 n=10 Tax=White spot syndrome virus TaxID=342409 RepID=Q77JA7_WSSVS|nr:wsv002 [Shrimp white spot syndrome virus]YP_009220476.1 envelope protein [White spot syndrome virus]AUR53627.1 VP24 [White spot syndrome virus consensus sequence]AYW76489.1 VP24 [Procambarus clarkii virus]AAG23915.1 VP24 [White spot syndrome virus]AAK59319.1 major virion protein VP24 [White spot syndrome virus]AAK77700.1 ORF31, VP24, gene family 1 [White spot syndrome virus]